MLCCKCQQLHQLLICSRPLRLCLGFAVGQQPMTTASYQFELAFVEFRQSTKHCWQKVLTSTLASRMSLLPCLAQLTWFTMHEVCVKHPPSLFPALVCNVCCALLAMHTSISCRSDDEHDSSEETGSGLQMRMVASVSSLESLWLSVVLVVEQCSSRRCRAVHRNALPDKAVISAEQRRPAQCCSVSKCKAKQASADLQGHDLATHLALLVGRCCDLLFFSSPSRPKQTQPPVPYPKPEP